MQIRTIVDQEGHARTEEERTQLYCQLFLLRNESVRPEKLVWGCLDVGGDGDGANGVLVRRKRSLGDLNTNRNFVADKNRSFLFSLLSTTVAGLESFAKATSRLLVWCAEKRRT